MPRSPSLTAGYAVLGLLGLSDALGLILTNGDNGPPLAINIIGTILGLATLVGIFAVFRANRQGAASPRNMVLTVVVARALSALLGIPAFFADVPGGVKAFVAVGIVLTVVGLALIRSEVAEAAPGGTTTQLA